MFLRLLPKINSAPLYCLAFEGKEKFSLTLIGSLASSEDETHEDRVVGGKHAHVNEAWRLLRFLPQRTKTRGQ